MWKLARPDGSFGGIGSLEWGRMMTRHIMIGGIATVGIPTNMTYDLALMLYIIVLGYVFSNLG